MADMEFALNLLNHKGIIRIIQVIGREEIHTRDLYKKVSHTRVKDLKKAEALGLIERNRVKQEGVGQPRIYNKLTVKGRKLLEMSRKYEV